MGRRKHPKGMFPGRLEPVAKPPTRDEMGLLVRSGQAPTLSTQADHDTAILTLQSKGMPRSMVIRHPEIEINASPQYTDVTVFGDTQKQYLVSRITRVRLEGDLAEIVEH